MEYTLTISQKAIAENFPTLDIKDAAIVDFLSRFSHSPKIQKKIEDGKIYYWFDYGKIESENPLLRLGEEAIRKRLREMCGLGIFESHPSNSGSRKVFFAFGPKYELTHKWEPRYENPELLNATSGLKSRPARYENPDLSEKPRYENPDRSNTPKLKISFNQNQDKPIDDIFSESEPLEGFDVEENPAELKKLTGAGRQKKDKPGPYQNRDVASFLEIPEQVFFTEILNNGVWQDYKDHRREKKVGWYASAKSEALAVKKLSLYSNQSPETARIIINESRSNNWTGFFEIKKNGKQPYNNSSADAGPNTGLFSNGSDPFFAGVS